MNCSIFAILHFTKNLKPKHDFRAQNPAEAPHLHHERCIGHSLCEANHRTVVGEGAADVTSRIWRKRQKPQGSEKDITGGDEQEVNVVSFKIVNVGFITHLAIFFLQIEIYEKPLFQDQDSGGG